MGKLIKLPRCKYCNTTGAWQCKSCGEWICEDCYGASGQDVVTGDQVCMHNKYQSLINNDDWNYMQHD